MHTRSRSASITLATVVAATTASAAVIPFDPDGAGPAPTAQVGSLDFLPGNVLVRGDDPNSQTGNIVYYQARLGGLLNPAGQVIPTPGLNAPVGNLGYEITAVFGVDVFGSGVHNSTLSLAAVGSQVVNVYYSIYFDPARNASDLAGSGFRDGTRIFGGTMTVTIGSLFLPTYMAFALDNFNANDYAGISSIFASGGLKVIAGAVSVDPAFFPSGPNFSVVHDTTLATPYFHTDPSGSFEIGPDGSTVVLPVNTGPVNGEGPQSLLESDGAVGFQIIPEPASFGLLVIGALASLRHRRRI